MNEGQKQKGSNKKHAWNRMPLIAVVYQFQLKFAVILQEKFS